MWIYSQYNNNQCSMKILDIKNIANNNNKACIIFKYQRAYSNLFLTHGMRNHEQLYLQSKM